MSPRMMLVSAVLVTFLMSASVAMAQEGAWQQVGVQGTGFFTKDSEGNAISQHSTNSGGFLLDYRVHFYHWLAAEAGYGYARNTQNNFLPTGTFAVPENVHQITGAVVASVPRIFKLNPYVLSGTGGLIFAPTSAAATLTPGADRQTKPAFLYGGGADYDIQRHISLRVEYRGFVYKRPDFQMASLDSGATTHTAQPSAGIVFHF